MSNSISAERQGNALVLRFTRPRIRNPLSVDVIESLEGLIADGLSSIDIEIIIFAGSGNVFASGADLREIADLTAESAREFSLRGQRLMGTIAFASKPVIAAIHGFCFGGALDLALACGKRVASPSATFCHPGAGLGIITGWGGTQRLPRLIGQTNALAMFFTAERINATEALRIGLIDQISNDPLAESLANAGHGRSS